MRNQTSVEKRIVEDLAVLEQRHRQSRALRRSMVSRACTDNARADILER